MGNVMSDAEAPLLIFLAFDACPVPQLPPLMGGVVEFRTFSFHVPIWGRMEDHALGVGGEAVGASRCLRLYVAMPHSCAVGRGLVQHYGRPVEGAHGGCAGAMHVTMGAPDL